MRNIIRVLPILLSLALAIFVPVVYSGYAELRQAPSAPSHLEAAGHYQTAALRIPWRAELYERAGHEYYYAKEYSLSETAYQQAHQRNVLSGDGWVAWGDDQTEDGGRSGQTDLDAVKHSVDDATAAVLVQYPNFFGCLEDLGALGEIAHRAGALLVVSADPISLGLLKPPGEFGADIVTGEGQPLGIPLSYRGPYLGIFATRTAYVR